MNQLILASTSPYKKMLLERLGLEFTCRNPEVDETPLAGESPKDLALRLAEQKATAVANQIPGAWVIGADQVEELDGQILGKPGNHQRAVEQLKTQSGRSMHFHCGICLAQCSIGEAEIIKQVRLNTTEVQFRHLNSQQIERYLLADKPYDCAGSFKGEALGISLFSAVYSNDPSSLIGLPLIDLCTMLGDWGLEVP